MTPFVLDNGEQLNITPDEAAFLASLKMIYRPEPKSSDYPPDYYTTIPDVTLDEVEAALRARRALT